MLVTPSWTARTRNDVWAPNLSFRLAWVIPWKFIAPQNCLSVSAPWLPKTKR